MYCLPLKEYVIGGEEPANLRVFCHNSFPLNELNIYNFLSGVPVATRIFPAVDKTPPKFISPFMILSLTNFSPKGICQAIFPLFKFNADNFP